MTEAPFHWDKAPLYADGLPEFDPDACDCEACQAGYADIGDEDEVVEGIFDYRWRTKH